MKFLHFVPSVFVVALLCCFGASHGFKKVIQKTSETPRVDYVVYNADGFYNNSALWQPSQIQRPLAGDVVELLIVCDKEWGDIFGHDRQRILDYWTVYMWDVNNRYKTLPGLDISFVVTGVVVIPNRESQPFIEESRAPDGRVEHGRVLDAFSRWVYRQEQSGAVPKHDLAIIVSNAQQEWGGGLAWMHGACRMDQNTQMSIKTASFNDGGDWGSLTVGAHEMGHNLGAPHDDDANFPGGCSERGYIMGGGTDDLRWYFSSCSLREIGAFVGSGNSDCLRRVDATPAIDPSYSNPKAPTTTELCKITARDQEAFMEPGDERNCKSMRCVWPNHENPGSYWVGQFAPVDNAICGSNQRCFRGECRQQ